jgi:hypothetical protein
MFELLTCNAAVFAIAALYFRWKDSQSRANERRHVLRQRVSYMLWTAAQSA